MNGAVRNLRRQGRSIKGIVRTTGVSRQTVRRILAGTRDDVFRSCETTLDRWAERLNADWDGDAGSVPNCGDACAMQGTAAANAL